MSGAVPAIVALLVVSAAGVFSSLIMSGAIFDRRRQRKQPKPPPLLPYIPGQSSVDRPFVAYRVWKIINWENPVLRAVIVDWTWDTPVLCIPPSEIAKLPFGGGLHGFKDYKDAVGYANVAVGDAVVTAMGRVRFYGMVCEYERGYRASHAIVDKLWVAPVWGDAFRARLAKRYACEVGTFELVDRARGTTPPAQTQLSAPTMGQTFAQFLAAHTQAQQNVYGQSLLNAAFGPQIQRKDDT